MNTIKNIEIVTNRTNRTFYHELKESFLTCKKFYISVAFIHLSAISRFIHEFDECKKRGVIGQIITTNYMNNTEPHALEILAKYNNIETRIYDYDSNSKNGFHTKGYIFDMGEYYKVYIGSSNLTMSALKTNHEWNLSVVLKNDYLLSSIVDEFLVLWNLSIQLTSDFINNYKDTYYKQHDSEQQKTYEEIISFLQQSEGYKFINQLASFMDIDVEQLRARLQIEHSKDIKPNLMQEQALERLAELRLNGESKALVIAATGTGKTYLAAFDALQMQPKKLLFVVHRAKILKDAEKTFKNILPHISTGIVTGSEKIYNADYIFATNTMIGREDIINKYDPYYFDYVVIDEAHRSAASTYQNILNHFKPKFLLGMTATPERTDALSIFKLYDHNIAVEIRLRGALETKLVVPFHYFGIEDISTDLTGIKLDDIDKLAEKLNIKVRVDLIIENIEKYSFSGKKRRALGFCVNKKHAFYMAEQFNQLGYPSLCLTGDDDDNIREHSIARLEDPNDSISYIFTVDIFNEGIDIPSVNMILMLRPTESPIVFTQQLGRGLRHFPYKDFLTVLDFIGNHNKSFLIPMALVGDKKYDKDDLRIITKKDFFDIPGDSFIRLDPIVKDRILLQLESQNFNEMKYLKESYEEIKRLVISQNKEIIYPRLMNFDFGDIDPLRFIDKKGTYINFVNDIEKINDLNRIIDDSNMYKFIKFIDDRLPIKRVYEFSILRILIDGNSFSVSELQTQLSRYIDNPSISDIEHSIKYLEHAYFSSEESKKYGKAIEVNSLKISISNEFRKQLSNVIFSEIINDSIEYGLMRYYHEFGRENYGYPFLKLFQTYKKIDVPQLARFEKGFIGLIMTGLYSIGDHSYISVNLNKIAVKESVDYQDKFLDNQTFQWESPNSTSQNSEVGMNLIQHKARNRTLHLFVRKFSATNSIDKGYSTDLTYLGVVFVEEYSGNKPIRFKFKLENPIPESLYLNLTEV